MHSYDEDALVHQLGTINIVRRTAFAAACAQRLLPLYLRFSAHSDGSHPDELMAIADRIWVVLNGQVPWDLTADQRLAEDLVPDEDHDGIFETGYAQHAAASVAYAVRSWLTGSPEEAAWAARQVYDAADYAAQNAELDLGGSQDGETALLESTIVQEALGGITDDLTRVRANSCDFRELRARAQAGGRKWSRSLP